MSTIVSILLAVLILLVMILVHEFGHYTVGKIFNFKINEFAVGFGPALFKKKKSNGEVISLRAFPLGGFCAFEGEDEDNDNPNAFNNKKPYQRILVLIAGAFMNYLLALIVIMIGFGVYGQSALGVISVMPQSQEYVEYSLQENDIIYSVNGKAVFMATDLTSAIKGKKAGDIVKVTVIRNGKKQNVEVKLRSNVNPDNLADLGIIYKSLGIGYDIQHVKTAISGKAFKEGDFITFYGDENGERLCTANDVFNRLISLSGDKATFTVQRENGYEKVEATLNDEYYNLVNAYNTNSTEENKKALLNYFGIDELDNYITNALKDANIKLGFFSTLSHSLIYSVKLGGTIFQTLGELLTGSLGLESVGGTITTIKLTSEVVKIGGFEYFLRMMALIGVNLAVFNLLPIPALDGMKVLFTAIEWIIKKPVNRKLESILDVVGLVVLVGFAILVDVMHLFA